MEETRCCRTMEETIEVLNSLQCNASVLHQAKLARSARSGVENVNNTVVYLERTGLTLDTLDRLPIIHISGTKGKGSTCAFLESILRAHGYKTGLYTSPHLVAVRERIRINGEPLQPEMFIKYFWTVYNRLQETKSPADDTLPAYFKFLTLMAFHVFIREKVDVAIIEVGIGGRYDCTNIIRSPIACGVTSLGLDHTSLLGNTVEKIAWHKAGIFKAGCPAVTVPQPGHSLQVLLEEANTVKCPLYMSPDLHQYRWPPGGRGAESGQSGGGIELGLAGDVQHWNATLALQLANIFISGVERPPPHHHHTANGYIDDTSSPASPSGSLLTAPVFPITELMANGVRGCVWPGRSQVMRYPHDQVTIYLDGAHTPRSIQYCCQWFLETLRTEQHQQQQPNTGTETSRSGICKVLIFNSTGDRQPQHLLASLKRLCDFDIVLFCPNMVSVSTQANSDNLNLMVTKEGQVARCYTNRAAWLALPPYRDASSTTNGGAQHNGALPGDASPPQDALPKDASSTKSMQEVQCSCQNLILNNGVTSLLSNGDDSHAGQQQDVQDDGKTFVFPCISSALSWVCRGELAGRVREVGGCTPPPTPPRPPALQASRVHILVTGSFHLVGGVLSILQQELPADSARG